MVIAKNSWQKHKKNKKKQEKSIDKGRIIQYNSTPQTGEAVWERDERIENT